MLANQNILCIGFPTWEGDYLKTIVQILTQFTVSNKVLYVDYEFTYKDILDGITGKKKNVPVKRMLGLSPRLRQLPTSKNGLVHVLTPPPVMPVNWIKNEEQYSYWMKKNARKVEKSIHSALQHLGMTGNLIVINAFNPFFGNPLARRFNEKLLLYYCYDEISAAAWAKNHGKQQEEKFIPKTDAVITTSKGLFEAKKQLHPNTFLVKNGVDFEAFNRGLSKTETFIPKNTFEKTVGYIGAIDFRMDLPLMEFAVETLSQYLFAFIGKVTDARVRQTLEKYPNVRFLGAKPIDELPYFAADFDIGIIPFERNEFTRKIYPLKINEYFALGKPVVMTDFGDMSDFAESASIVHNKEEFIKALQHELHTDNIEKQQIRINIARANSWENRAEELANIIEQLL